MLSKSNLITPFLIFPKTEAHSTLPFSWLKLSARAYGRIHKIARTIADLEGADQIGLPHLSEAIGYRSLDREVA